MSARDEILALSGSAYILGSWQTPTSAQYGAVQIKNPAASGVAALVDQITLSIPAGLVRSIRRYDTDLATDVGAGLNVDIGGANAKCHVRQETNATLNGSIITRSFDAAGGTLVHDFKRPLVLSPGQGIMLVCETVNNGVFAVYEWREVTA